MSDVITMEEKFNREFTMFLAGLPDKVEQTRFTPGLAVYVTEPTSPSFGLHGIIIEIKRGNNPFIRVRIPDENGSFIIRLDESHLTPAINLKDDQMGILNFYGDESRAYMENSRQVHALKRSREKQQDLDTWTVREGKWRDARLMGITLTGDPEKDLHFEFEATGPDNYTACVTLDIDVGLSLVTPMIRWSSYSRGGAIQCGPQFALLIAEMIGRASELGTTIMRNRYPNCAVALYAAVAP